MVSKWWIWPKPPLHLQDRHQSKIYVESNHSHFWRILRDLTSMQTLAIYRRLIVRDSEINCNTIEKRQPGSRDVFSASHGVLGRVGAGAVAQRQDTGIEQTAAAGRVRSRVRCH